MTHEDFLFQSNVAYRVFPINVKKDEHDVFVFQVDGPFVGDILVSVKEKESKGGTMRVKTSTLVFNVHTGAAEKSSSASEEGGKEEILLSHCK